MVHKLLRVSPAPVLVAAPAGALPNASEGERLRPVAYESCKNGFVCEKVEQVEEKKTAPPAPDFSAGAGALPNGP